MEWVILAFVIAVILALLIARTAPLVVVEEGRVGLVYRNGRLLAPLGPGVHFRLGWRVRVELVDVRRQQIVITGQEVLTADSVSVKLSLLAEVRIFDATLAVRETSGWSEKLRSTLQVVLRSRLARRSFDEVLRDRESIGAEVRERAADELLPVGIELLQVAVRDIMLSADLRRAFAESLRLREEGKAALEKARAETAALRALANAARMLKDNPELREIRLLQSIETAAGKPGTGLVLGAPLDFSGSRRSERASGQGT